MSNVGIMDALYRNPFARHFQTAVSISAGSSLMFIVVSFNTRHETDWLLEASGQVIRQNFQKDYQKCMLETTGKLISQDGTQVIYVI